MSDGPAGNDGRMTPRPLRASRRGVLRTMTGVGLAGLGATEAVSTVAADESDEDGHVHGPAMDLVPMEAVTHEAVADGPWSAASTWNNGVPDADARVYIPADTTVTLDGETAPLHWLRVAGTYRVDPATDTHLRVETIVTELGSRFAVGSADAPVAPDAVARTTFLDRGPIDVETDTQRVGRGLLTMGDVEIRGREKTAWDALASFPTAGDETIELAGTPSGWSAGDRVVIAPVEDADHDEVREVVSVDGGTVTLAEPLAFDHVPPEDDLSVHAGNLTRNVRFRSESREVSRRGHLMFMTSEGVVVENAGLYGLGRTDKSIPFTNPQGQADPGTNPKARYALHFHITGISRSQEAHRVTGCVVDGSPGWGVVNHHSYAHVTDCVSYDVFGAGFVTEAGDEQGSFVNNLAIKSEGSGQHIAHRENADPPRGPAEIHIDDFGHSGHGFWFHSPGTVNENNVAAGHASYGYVYWGMPLDEQGIDSRTEAIVRNGVMIPPNFPKEYGTFNMNESNNGSDAETETHIAQGYVSIRSFADNTAYAVGGGVALRWMKPQQASGQERHTRYGDYSKIQNFTAYNVLRDSEQPLEGGNGISLTWSSHVWIRNCRLHGAGVGRGINRGWKAYNIANVMVQDTLVENFAVGIAASPGPNAIIAGCTLDNHRTNVRSLPGTIHKSGTLWLHNNVFRGATTNLFRHFVSFRNCLTNFYDVYMDVAPNAKTQEVRIFKNKSNVRVDGTKLYFDYQLPDVKPFQEIHEAGRIPQQGSERAAVAYVRHGNERFEFQNAPAYPEKLYDPTYHVGKTNRQLDEQYDLRASGRMVPEDATRTDFVDRAWVMPAEGTDVADGAENMPPKLPGMVTADEPTVGIDGAATATPGETVTFTGGATDPNGGEITRLEWSVDDKRTTGEEFTHTFEQAGTYAVTLTATNDMGRRGTVRHQVEVTEGGGPVVIDAEEVVVEPGETTEVDVVATEIPDGLAGSSFTATVRDDRVATVADATVVPDFSVAEASVEEASVSFTVLDETHIAEAGDGPVTLGRITVAGEREGASVVELDVDSLNDDAGESVAPTVRPGRVHVGPGIAPADEGLGLPTDPDGDGQFEDVNGNEDVDYADVVELAQREDDGIADNAEAFDFEPDGVVTHGDLLSLLEEV